MIKLILSAPVHQMADAFNRVFGNTDNVNIVRKPFENISEFDCMVSAANSFGLMDGGVDAAITAFFGTQLQTRVQNHIIREYLGEQPVGSAFVIETGDNHHPWLVHAPTMRVPLTIDGTDAVYNATWAALLAIFQHNKNAITDRKIKTVVFPAMGAGCGQVPFESVARQMKLAWDNFNKKQNQLTGNTHIPASGRYLTHVHTAPVNLVVVMLILNILDVAITVRIAYGQGRYVLSLNIRLMTC